MSEKIRFYCSEEEGRCRIQEVADMIKTRIIEGKVMYT